MTREPVHFSQLKAIGTSPLHYKHELENGRGETKALRLGDAVDALLFGTSRVIGFDGQRRGKAWDAFVESSAGAICLNTAEMNDVLGMAAAVRRRSDALELLEGERQRTLHWAIGNRQCEGTPDVFTSDRIVELKTARSTHPERFKWQAMKLGYHAQLSWYSEAMVSCGLPRPSKSYIVAVESTPPYPVTVFELTDRAIDKGHRSWRLWWERLMASEESDAWPAYAEGIVPFDVDDDEVFSLRIGGEEVDVE